MIHDLDIDIFPNTFVKKKFKGCVRELKNLLLLT